MDEREEGPITYEIYQMIYRFDISKGDVFVWSFTFLQWSWLYRFVLIVDLTFGQFLLGTGSFIIEYCDSKSDQKGERTSQNIVTQIPSTFMFASLRVLVVTSV